MPWFLLEFGIVYASESDLRLTPQAVSPTHASTFASGSSLLSRSKQSFRAARLSDGSSASSAGYKEFQAADGLSGVRVPQPAAACLRVCPTASVSALPVCCASTASASGGCACVKWSARG